jgi:DNA-binding protein H-NS
MARPKSYAKMSLEALIEMRDSVTSAISEQAENLQKQLSRLTGGGDSVGHGKRRGRPPGKVKTKGSKLKGRKVAPKYRGPGGETWAGRGARPRWLVAALKGGKTLDSFLIKRQTKR